MPSHEPTDYDCPFCRVIAGEKDSLTSQDVWHLHVHVFPRYLDDHLYSSKPRPGFVTGELRRPYAELLRSALHQ